MALEREKDEAEAIERALKAAKGDPQPSTIGVKRCQACDRMLTVGNVCEKCVRRATPGRQTSA